MMGFRLFVMVYVISVDFLLLAAFTDPTLSSFIEVESNTLPLPCPADSTPGEDGNCVCDHPSCEEPFCDKHLNKITDFTETPGSCCPTYRCESCPSDFTHANETCPCEGDTFLNQNHECECADPEKTLQNGECVCDESKCPVDQKCDVHSVEVITKVGCCSKIECKLCPFDSHPTAYSSSMIENKCVCSVCEAPECPLDKHAVLERKGTGFPGSCCNSYICVNANETCLQNNTYYANGDSWSYNGDKYECRSGNPLCTSCNSSKICIYNSTSYRNNEIWFTSDNEKCECHNGISLCSKEPEDISCVSHGKIHQHLSSWTTDGCNNCTCNLGTIKCIADLCKMVNVEIKDTPDCPPLNTCKKDCNYGYKLNKYGCEVCKCKPPKPYEGRCKYGDLERVMEVNGLVEGVVIRVIEDYLRLEEAKRDMTTTTTETPALMDHCHNWWIYMITGMGVMFFVYILKWMATTFFPKKTKRSMSFGKHFTYEMQPFKKTIKKEKYISAT